VNFYVLRCDDSIPDNSALRQLDGLCLRAGEGLPTRLDLDPEGVEQAGVFSTSEFVVGEHGVLGWVHEVRRLPVAGEAVPGD
jgi:hypothetical protein